MFNSSSSLITELPEWAKHCGVSLADLNRSNSRSDDEYCCAYEVSDAADNNDWPELVRLLMDDVPCYFGCSAETLAERIVNSVNTIRHFYATNSRLDWGDSAQTFEAILLENIGVTVVVEMCDASVTWLGDRPAYSGAQLDMAHSLLAMQEAELANMADAFNAQKAEYDALVACVKAAENALKETARTLLKKEEMVTAATTMVAALTKEANAMAAPDTEKFDPTLVDLREEALNLTLRDHEALDRLLAANGQKYLAQSLKENLSDVIYQLKRDRGVF